METTSTGHPFLACHRSFRELRQHLVACVEGHSKLRDPNRYGLRCGLQLTCCRCWCTRVLTNALRNCQNHLTVMYRSRTEADWQWINQHRRNHTPMVTVYVKRLL